MNDDVGGVTSHLCSCSIYWSSLLLNILEHMRERENIEKARTAITDASVCNCITHPLERQHEYRGRGRRGGGRAGVSGVEVAIERKGACDSMYTW